MPRSAAQRHRAQDLYAAVVGALCAAQGSLHCGANVEALRLMRAYDKNAFEQRVRGVCAADVV